MAKRELGKLAETLAILAKKYGDGSVIDFSKEKPDKMGVETISTGLPSLDIVLGQGLPKGRIIEIYGKESSGKTTLALHCLAQFKKEDKRIAYIDIENSFDPNYAKILGIDLNELLYSQPASGEEALDIVEKLCQSGEVGAIVIDSVAQLVPASVAAKEIDGTANIGTTARLMSQNLPRLSNAASKSKTTIIFINQIRMKIGVMHGNPETTPGGLALKFAASVRLEVSKSKAESRYGEEGQPVRIKARKNKVAPPFRETELFLIFGKGFHYLSDIVNTAVNFEIITKAGGWYSYGDAKAQGAEGITSVLMAKEGYMEKIIATLREIKI